HVEAGCVDDRGTLGARESLDAVGRLTDVGGQRVLWVAAPRVEQPVVDDPVDVVPLRDRPTAALPPVIRKAESRDGLDAAAASGQPRENAVRPGGVAARGVRHRLRQYGESRLRVDL